MPIDDQRERMRRLEPIIGRWITLGTTVDFPQAPSMPVSTSDIYEWAVARSHVVHSAYGFAGDRPGGGTEIIRYDETTGDYQCHFFDDTGAVITQSLTIDGDRWTWTGGQRRCRAVLNADATELLAEHEATTDDGATWFPTATVTLYRGD